MPTLSQHVCFSCRKVFKKPHFYSFLHPKGTNPPVYRCPECGEAMTYMGYKFRAPPMLATKDWKRIEENMKLGVAWEKPTRRKEKPVPTISPALKKALSQRYRKKA